MLSNLFIFLIGLLLVIQDAESTVVIDPTTCAHLQTTIRASVNEMIQVAEAAYNRTNSAFYNQVSIRELKVVLFTFDAYFTSNDDEATATDLLCLFPPPK